MAKNKFLKRNLVFLMYSPNVCYAKVVGKQPEEIEVDLQMGTWSYKEKQLNHGGWQEFKIGSQVRHCSHGSRGGMIGVYDRTNVQHLDSMVHAAAEATRDRSGAFEVD